MAYNFYLDKILLPVAPSKLQLKISNKNKTMTLINDVEINILKKAGLTDITLDVLLPNVKYPFATYKGNSFKKAEYFLKKIEKLKTQIKAFQFIVVRESPSGDALFDTNIKVSLEDYTISEDADDGLDVTVSIKLKQYKNYGTKTVVITKPVESAQVQSAILPSYMSTPNYATAAIPAVRDYTNNPSNNIPNPYIAQSGDTLWNICKRFYGDGGVCYVVAPYNNLSTPDVYVGQSINFPK